MNLLRLATGLAFVLSCRALLGSQELWPGGIMDVPAEKGAAGFTVAYSAPTAWGWVTPEGNGGKYGYLLTGQYVLGVLTSNERGDAGPPETIAFYGHTDWATPVGLYSLATSNQSAVPGDTVPPTVSQSMGWTIDRGGRLTLVPEPVPLTLLLLGFAALLGRRP